MQDETTPLDYKIHLSMVVMMIGVMMLIGSVYADEGTHQSQSNQVQQTKNVCKADYKQFCQHATGNRIQVAQCMQQHEAQLSDTCRAAIKQVHARYRQLIQACEEDVQQQCASVQAGGGRIFRCLQQHANDISTACKAALQHNGAS